MNKSYTHCPKCGKEFPQALPASASRPNRGLYFFKWDQPVKRREAEGAGPAAALLAPRGQMDAATFYGRAGAWILLAIWSGMFFRYDCRTAKVNDSFLH